MRRFHLPFRSLSQAYSPRTQRVCASIAPVLALTLGLGAVRASAETFVVDATHDAPDADLEDPLCADGDGFCTLRAAVQQANATTGEDEIDLTLVDDPEEPIQLTIDGIDESWIENTDPETMLEEPFVVLDEHDASMGDLDVTESLTITGAGSDATVIEWSKSSQTDGDPFTGDRIFNVVAVDQNLSVGIHGVKIRNGSVGIEPNEDCENPPEETYNILCNEDETIWQFRRLGGGVALGTGAAIVLFDPAIHGGPGGGVGGGGKGPFPGGEGDEDEFSITEATLEDVVIVHNTSGADGGGVYNAAPLSLVDAVVSGNVSGANGGGIYNDNAAVIVNTTIGRLGRMAEVSSGNSAENGGGMFDTGSHVTEIVASSIVGNDAIGGAGIAGRSGIHIEIANSTISGNSAFDTGGGITTNGLVTLRNVTITANTAASDAGFGGAGVNSFGAGTYTIVNTILSNNVVGERPANCGCTGGTCNVGTKINSLGHNIEDVDSCAFFLEEDLAETDPLILALADNGGLTDTHDLDTESPAIDFGAQAVCDDLPSVTGGTDQRGASRTIDGNEDGDAVCDAGAVEFVPEPRGTLAAALALATLVVLTRARSRRSTGPTPGTRGA